MSKLDPALKRHLESLNARVNGMLKQRLMDRDRIEALERRQRQLEQAILELAATLRRSGPSDGVRVLSLPPSEARVPDRQSADASSTLPA